MNCARFVPLAGSPKLFCSSNIVGSGWWPEALKCGVSPHYLVSETSAAGTGECHMHGQIFPLTIDPVCYGYILWLFRKMHWPVWITSIFVAVEIFPSRFYLYFFSY